MSSISNPSSRRSGRALAAKWPGASSVSPGNLLGRALASRGTFSCHDDELFFFRLNTSDEEGLREAAKIVNEIGAHFLRDAFEPEEFLPAVLSVVEARDAIGVDGEFDPDNALAARAAGKVEFNDTGPVWRPIGGRGGNGDRDAEWRSTGGASLEDGRDVAPEWQLGAREKRTAGVRVARGQERRNRRSPPPAGLNRRTKARGRRDADDPNQSVW